MTNLTVQTTDQVPCTIINRKIPIKDILAEQLKRLAQIESDKIRELKSIEEKYTAIKYARKCFLIVALAALVTVFAFMFVLDVGVHLNRKQNGVRPIELMGKISSHAKSLNQQGESAEVDFHQINEEVARQKLDKRIESTYKALLSAKYSRNVH